MAGRPPLGKLHVTTTIRPDLREQAHREGNKISEALEFGVSQKLGLKLNVIKSSGDYERNIAGLQENLSSANNEKVRLRDVADFCLKNHEKDTAHHHKEAYKILHKDG